MILRVDPAFAAVQKLVRAGAPDDGFRALNNERDAGRVAAMAHFHGVDGRCRRALHTDDRYSLIAAALEAAYDTARFHHLRIIADLQWLDGLLADLGVAWAVLKGPVLSEFMYPAPDLRSYGDLDVLVDRRSVGDVLAHLESAGARMIDRNWPLIAATARGELSLVLPHGSLLDLHWHLIVEADIRREFRIDIDDVLDRRRTLTARGLAVPTLSDTDTLWYLCLHAGLSGAHRLVWLDDIRQALAFDGLPDSDAHARYRAFGVALLADVMLRKASLVLGTPTVGRAGSPSVVGAGQSLLDRTLGFGRGARTRFSTRTLATSLRSSDRASVRALAIAVRPSRSGTHRNDDQHLNPLHLDVPSPLARRQFLEEIAR